MNLANTTRISAAQIASRIAAAVLGGWSFTWGFVSLAVTGLVAAGQPYTEAHTAAMLLAFIVFLVAFCWSFTAALMTGAAWLLQGSQL
jgi:hypothetical protein